MAAISRADIDTSGLHKYRICSRHFVSNYSADLYDSTNPAGLPTLHLGHEKHGDTVTSTSTSDKVERYRRAQERERWKEINEFLLDVVTKEMDSVITEEIESIVTGKIETAISAMQYFVPKSCEYSSKIKSQKGS